jgi:hypothetical protein
VLQFISDDLARRDDMCSAGPYAGPPLQCALTVEEEADEEANDLRYFADMLRALKYNVAAAELPVALGLALQRGLHPSDPTPFAGVSQHIDVMAHTAVLLRGALSDAASRGPHDVANAALDAVRFLGRNAVAEAEALAALRVAAHDFLAEQADAAPRSLPFLPAFLLRNPVWGDRAVADEPLVADLHAGGAESGKPSRKARMAAAMAGLARSTAGPKSGAPARPELIALQLSLDDALRIFAWEHRQLQSEAVGVAEWLRSAEGGGAASGRGPPSEGGAHVHADSPFGGGSSRADEGPVPHTGAGAASDSNGRDALSGGGVGGVADLSKGGARLSRSSSGWDVSTLRVSDLLYGRATSARMFLRAAGYRPVDDALVSQPSVSRVLGEGCQLFLDTRGRWCMAYNCSGEDGIAAAQAVALAGGERVRVEHYRGPAFPNGEYAKRVAVGNVSIHRPYAAVFRAEGSSVVPWERLQALLSGEEATEPRFVAHVDAN